MLERFKPLPEDTIRVTSDSLRDAIEGIFLAMGNSSEDAAEGANTLIMTDLRGVETHGVSNMLRSYVDGYNNGKLNPTPNLKVISDAPSVATIDGDQGLAVITGPKVMRIAIEKARNTGIGSVALFNTGHSGGIGHHAMLAVEEDMIGLVMTAAGCQVLPTFAAEPRIGTNPIAIAAPARNEPPFLFDAATSAVAGNKTELARRVGSNMLPGWLANLDGSPILEEFPVPQRGETWQLPLGGVREQGSHKGFGFGMMPEILGTLLAGVQPSMLDPEAGQRHHFAAYDISKFTDIEIFKDNMDSMLEKLRTTPPAPGEERVLYPGLYEYEQQKERKISGIPLHEEVVEWFENVSGELQGVPQLVKI